MEIKHIKGNKGLKINLLGYAGSYAINGNFYIALYKKPNWWHRMWTKLLLGWEWKDAG